MSKPIYFFFIWQPLTNVSMHTYKHLHLTQMHHSVHSSDFVTYSFVSVFFLLAHMGVIPKQKVTIYYTYILYVKNDFQHQLQIKLTHSRRLTHICVTKLTMISSDNGLSPCQHQTILWTNAWILLTAPLWTTLREKINRDSYIFIQ